MPKKEMQINGRPIFNAVTFGEWKETAPEGVRLVDITGDEADKDDETMYDGLIIKGYETLNANGFNVNGERYKADAFDKFVKEYFVAKGLNMPVDVEHNPSPEWLVGKVLKMTADETGQHYVVFVPREHPKFEYVRMCIKNGLLQGFSKMGWATKWKPAFDDNGNWIGDDIEEFELVRMSLVATPANGLAFENVQEAIRDGLRYKASGRRNGIDAFFVK